MAKFQIPGLSEAKGDVGGGGLFEKGEYLVEVKEAIAGESKNGYHQLVLRTEIQQAATEGENGGLVGRRMTCTCVVNPEYEFMVNRLKSFCLAFGVSVAKDGFYNPDNFVGKTGVIYAAVKTDKQTGEPRNEFNGTQREKSKHFKED